jgi:hypothetical protein
MKYVSLDIETTCLEPKEPKNILGISMVLEDSDHPEIPVTDLPCFTCIIGHERVEGTPLALALNAWIFLEIEKWKKGKATKYPVYRDLSAPTRWSAGLNGMYPEDTWLAAAMRWLDHHYGTDRINLAGKNAAGFDVQFLPTMLAERFRHRVIDPGSALVDWSQRTLPDLSTLKQKAGLGGIVSHDMYEDAMDVISVLRTTYPKKGNA